MQLLNFQIQGQRQYQQDDYQIDQQQGLFIVCDGVGGGVRGDIASKITSSSIARAVREKSILPTDANGITALLQIARSGLLEHIQASPHDEGMSTTLVMAFIQDGWCTLAHIGDSRAYYFNAPSQRVWHTRDHSLVQELFDAGILKTEAEMTRHPMRNRITRVLVAYQDEALPQAAIQRLPVQPGDILVLCSDGVLEPFTSSSDFEKLIFDTNTPLINRFEQLKQRCEQDSRDNATCILIAI
jgi:PPM family protein phosphatase